MGPTTSVAGLNGRGRGLWWLRALLVATCCCWLLLAAAAAPAPAPAPLAGPSHNARSSGNRQAIEAMRHIPQWHCLRYRRFDLVKRCRNYRGGRRH